MDISVKAENAKSFRCISSQFSMNAHFPSECIDRLLLFCVSFFFFFCPLFHSWQLCEWYSVCPALFSARPSKACRIARVALHVIPRPSMASTRCLSDKHSRCWHYQMLSACRPPLVFALLWLLGEVSGLATWLWVTEEVRVCACVLVSKHGCVWACYK